MKLIILTPLPRFLLHQQSKNFIRLDEAHLDAALTCATYLSFTSLDTVFSPTEEGGLLDSQILAGDFVLLKYAALECTEHIADLITDPRSVVQDAVEELVPVLGCLLEKRKHDISVAPDTPKAYHDRFQVFKKYTELQDSLASAAWIMKAARVMGSPLSDSTYLAKYIL